MGSRCFIYSGSNTSARVAIDIAQELLKERLDVRYGCFGHVRSIGQADFELLRRSGCEAIFYGLESGSERILREAFNKPLDLAEAERVIRQTKEAGICAIASVIYPAPFEDAESRRDTLEFLRRVRPDSVPVTIPGMIPGTPWEKDPEKYGFKKSERADIWEYGLTYKIKLLFPPSLWKPLPYTLNGKSSKQLFAECEAFIRDIEAEGLVTDLSHESVLMADALGERNDLPGFRDRCRAMFLSGDVERISAMVEAINRNVGAAGCVEQGGPCRNEAMTGIRRSVVLFMPEGSILAHVGRTVAIANAMNPNAFDIRFAASGRMPTRLTLPAGRSFRFTRRIETNCCGRLKTGGSAFTVEELQGICQR